MLIEFNFENFRAAREEQNFSMVAANRKEHQSTHVFRPCGVPGDVFAPDLLRTAALYGPNAGGKTNFVRALWLFKFIVTESSGWGPERQLPITPFLFSQKTKDEPSSFEVVFVSEGVRYQYGFAASATRVVEEWLYAFPLGKAQRWFAREYNPESEKYDVYFGPNLLGEKETWRRATRPNALLLSTAVQLNSEQLLPVYRWFERVLHIVPGGGRFHPAFTLEQFLGDSRRSILDFLQKADLSIEDLKIDRERVSPRDLPDDIHYEMLLPVEAEDGDSRKLQLYKVRSVHKTSEGDFIPLDWREESDGTDKMLSLAGPWLHSLANGHTLIVDELHQSLHPMLLKHLVTMFHDPGINRKGAQLIFTTHNTSILSQEIFRRDQIWLFERDKQQASKLYPLSDFKVRKGAENLELAYLSGRYGGLPFVRKLDPEIGVGNG